MAMRSIKLKIRLDRSDAGRAVREALWLTHELTNQGIRYYMDWLVLLRQQKLGSRTAEEVRQELLVRLRTAQRENLGGETPGNDEEILTLARRLYEYLVPQAVGEKGDAQSLSRQMFSLFVDKNSSGGGLGAPGGRKPSWVVMKEEGRPGWEEAKARYEQRKAGEAESLTDGLLRPAKFTFGILPLFSRFSCWVAQQRNMVWRGSESKWDRDMFQQALERLFSWEAWNQRVAEARHKRQAKLAEFLSQYFDPVPSWHIALRDYEKTRTAELKAVGFPTDDEYRIKTRALKGWDRIRAAWLELPENALEEHLVQVLNELQSRLRGEFGDHHLFRFLAEPRNHSIWRDPRDLIRLHAIRNAMEFNLARAKEEATYTPPDAVDRPTWTRYEGRGGNIHQYEVVPGGSLQLKCKLLAYRGNEIIEEDASLQLVPSKQFDSITILSDKSPEDRKNKQKVRVLDQSTGVVLDGELRGAKIQFERDHLKHHRNHVPYGDVGPVYLNLVVDVKPAPFTGSDAHKTRRKVFRSFRGTEGHDTIIGYKETEVGSALAVLADQRHDHGVDGLQIGIRVMSVDLGVRQLAAASVFELTTNRPKNTLWFPVALAPKEVTFGAAGMDSVKLFAKHVRSFLIRLPGENPDKTIEHYLETSRQERRQLKLRLRALSRVLAATVKETPQERQEALV